MDIYLVGGAVRDELLGLPIKDRDWVVVGASVQQMLDAGYRQVGRDFPVFLHPVTGEEHALARTERKRGSGYKGFVVHTDPSVTLAQDLVRRDLTINAMARAADGSLIDLHGGAADIKARLLRHVSPAFSEDPLRVLRVARFAARFAPLGFTVAPETLALMRELSDSGELAALTPERVWQEIEGALRAAAPQVFVQVLRDCGALPRLLPELHQLFGVPYGETADASSDDSGIQTLRALERATQLSPDPAVRFAALVHALGKASTPAPQHRGYEEAGALLVETMAQRLRIPNEYRDLGVMISRFRTRCQQALRHDAGERYAIVEATDALRRPQRFSQLLLACQACAVDPGDGKQHGYAQGSLLQHDLATARSVDVQAVLQQRSAGTDPGPLIRAARIKALAANPWQNDDNSTP